jgi:hypothetical protein
MRGRHRADDVPETNWLPGGPGVPRRYERQCPTCGKTYWATRTQRFCGVTCHSYGAFVDRLWSKVDTSGGPDACWPWTGSRHTSGHGEIWRKPVHIAAHRAVLEIKLGRPILPGLLACHTCDNPPCCNPGHLYEGTSVDNNRDTFRRGRHKSGWQGIQRDEIGRWKRKASREEAGL